MTDLDAVIVGGGATGALVARLLFDRGMRVLVLEAGERRAPADADEWERLRESWFDVDPEVWAYETDGEGFDWARVRALGGRTLVWGGWAYRASLHTFEDAGIAGVPFPFTPGELEPHYAEVERRMHVTEDPLSASFSPIRKQLGVSVVGKRAARFRGRPTSAADLLDGIPVETGAIVTRVVARNRRAEGVVVAGREDRFVRARNVVLAASAIETARLLLESASSGLPDETGSIGRGLVDHMISSVLLLDEARPGDAEGSAVIPRFVNVADRRRDYAGGFTTEVVGPLPGTSLGRDQLRILEIDERAAKTLRFFMVHAMGPTLPSPHRHVTLGAGHDTLGRRVPRVRTFFGDNERAMAREMDETCIAVADALAAPGAKVVPFMSPLASAAGHEAGTCRMGADLSAPVCPDGRLRGSENVWVVDASVLPLATDAHPTLALLAIAARTAARIG